MSRVDHANRLAAVFLFSIIFCILSSSFLEAKTWQELKDVIALSDSLSHEGNHDSAIFLCQTEIDNILEKQPAPDTMVVEFMIRISVYQWRFGNRALSDSLSIEALDLSQRLVGNNHPLVARAMWMRLYSLIFKKRTQEAVKIGKKAIEILENNSSALDTSAIKYLRLTGNAYWGLSNFQSALPYYQRAYEISEATLGLEDSTTIDNLFQIASLYHYMGKFEICDSIYMKVLELRLSLFGENNDGTARSYEQLGRMYNDLQKPIEAEHYLKKALAVKEKLWGEHGVEICMTLENLATFHWELGNLEDAEIVYLRKLSILERAKTENNSVNILWIQQDLAHTCLYVSRLYADMGNFEEVRRYLEKSIDLSIEIHGPESPDVADGLLSLVDLYNTIGDYNKSLELVKQALAIDSLYFDYDHIENAENRQALAGVYWKLGKYLLADHILNDVIESYEMFYGDDNRNLASLYNFVGIIKDNIGNLPESERYYRKSIVIYERTGAHPTTLAIVYSNLAHVFEQQGIYIEAVHYYSKLLKLYEQFHGPDNYALVTSLGNLGMLYVRLGRYSEASELLERRLVISETTFGENHIDVASTMIGLAIFERRQRNYDKAEDYYRRATLVFESNFDTLQSDPMNVYFGYARLKCDQNDYAAARELLLTAIKLNEKSGLKRLANNYELLGFVNHRLGDDEAALESFNKCRELTSEIGATGSYYFTMYAYRYADVLRKLGRREEAIQVLADAFNVLATNVSSNAKYLPESQMAYISRNFRTTRDRYLSVQFESGLLVSDADESASNIVLIGKGIVTDGVFERHLTMQLSDADSTVQGLQSEFDANKFQLAKIYSDGPGDDISEFTHKVDSLTATIDRIERDLTNRSEDFRQRQKSQQISVETAAAQLPDRTLMIEYLNYEFKSVDSDSSTRHIAVLWFGAGINPRFLNLGEAAPIDSLVELYQGHMNDIASLQHFPRRSEGDEYEAIARELYDRVLKPVVDSVHNIDQLFIAPDGALNLVSFPSLIDEDGTYLIEKFAIHHLSAGRDLIRLKNRDESGSGLLAMGDPDFNASVSSRLGTDEATILASVDVEAQYRTRNIRAGCSDLDDLEVSPIPYTRSEVNSIYKAWQSVGRETAAVFVGPQASEDNFKKEAPGKRVIHLATHGYYLTDQCNPKQQESGLDIEHQFVSENPLLLSGLLFAGANLHGEGADSLDVEDGILSAQEVASMDFRGTDMVVLSACETGLGKVEMGEGVYGLRRAFQMAGARTVISALWPVSDKHTARIMAELYKQTNETIPAKMRRVQLAEIDKLRKAGLTEHPFTWGAWIATGDWR